MNGLCPACRRPYDEKTIEWKVVSPEEFKADVQKQARKKAEIRQKEAQKREVESLNRKHLSGLRVVQKNLVYVVGLNPRIREEDLLQTLRGEQYFGQYGKIIKIVVSKAKDGAQGNQPLGVYVTFARVQDAERCIAAVDGSENGGRTLRAQFGTTKYCSAYLRNETCPNKSCMFLHEPGEEKDSFTRQDLSSINVVSTQRPAPPEASSSGPSGGQGSQQATSHDPVPQPAPPAPRAHAIAAASQPMGRQASRDDATTLDDNADGSALPSSASWANKGSQQQQQSRSTSQPASVASPSPMVPNATLSSAQTREANKVDAGPSAQTEAAVIKQPLQLSNPSKSSPTSTSVSTPLLNELLKSVSSPQFKFIFSATLFSPEDKELIINFPPLLDPDGGAKRRAARKHEQELQQERLNRVDESEQMEGQAEDVPGSGSLQLGGEPEEVQGSSDIPGHMDGSTRHGQEQQHRAIQPPSQQNPSSALPQGLGFGQISGAESLANMSLNGRSYTPSQQRFPGVLRSSDSASFMNQLSQNISVGQGPQTHSGLFPNQAQQLSAPQGHARQSSRYNFAGDPSSASAAIKPAANAKLMAQQSAMMPSGSTAPHQQGFGGPFYGTAVQGPPPGLKSVGTPPIGGDGMFSQGHGFAGGLGSATGLGAGVDEKSELLRGVFRSRGGVSGAGSIGQASEAGKREYLFPSLLQQQYPPSATPSPGPGFSGASSLFGGPHAGAFQDLGPQKPKKNKGKKHRHANTSSSGGGGIVNLADPSILQARMHQQQAGISNAAVGAGAGAGVAGGQAFFGGGQGQGGYNPSLLYGNGFGRW